MSKEYSLREFSFSRYLLILHQTKIELYQVYQKRYLLQNEEFRKEPFFSESRVAR
jgi:hypothetical protein